jgi:hypothetical protein
VNDRARTTRILPDAAKTTRSVVLAQPEHSGKSQRQGTE